MKFMCKHWGLHISTNINCLEVVLGSFWVVWRGFLLSLELKLRSWWFLRYWWFNKWYHGGYLLICLISRPLLIALRCDLYISKGLFKGFKLALRPWESLKNWWRYDQMKFVTSTLDDYMHYHMGTWVSNHNVLYLDKKALHCMTQTERRQEWWECVYHKWLLTWFVIWEKSSSREFKQGLDNNKRCC